MLKSLYFSHKGLSNKILSLSLSFCILALPHLSSGTIILWNSIALTSEIFIELVNTMKYGEGVLYIFVTGLPFKRVSGDVTASHFKHTTALLSLSDHDMRNSLTEKLHTNLT